MGLAERMAAAVDRPPPAWQVCQVSSNPSRWHWFASGAAGEEFGVADSELDARRRAQSAAARLSGRSAS